MWAKKNKTKDLRLLTQEDNKEIVNLQKKTAFESMLLVQSSQQQRKENDDNDNKSK